MQLCRIMVQNSYIIVGIQRVQIARTQGWLQETHVQFVAFGSNTHEIFWSTLKLRKSFFFKLKNMANMANSLKNSLSRRTRKVPK